ncbi:MAG: TRAP transporter small permease subunit [Proteobacteria bacterium]|nr:TRAP transporter small permease subunit [Pseudomonadota bacterium]
MIKAIKTGFLKIDGWVAMIEVIGLCITMTFLFSVGFYQVASREIGGSGAVWPEHLLRYSVLVLGFLGASLAVRENRNIKIDLLTHVIGQRGGGGGRVWQITEGLLYLLATGISFFMVDACIEYIKVEQMLGMPIPNTVIPAYVIFYFPIAFFVISGIRYLFYGIFKIIGQNIEMDPSENQPS